MKLSSAGDEAYPVACRTDPLRGGYYYLRSVQRDNEEVGRLVLPRSDLLHFKSVMLPEFVRQKQHDLKVL